MAGFKDAVYSQSEREEGRQANTDSSRQQQILLETQDLTIRFGGHTAVDRVSLTLKEKEFKSIIGPNGAGKTTFFNLISGQLKPTEGQISYQGEEIHRLSTHQRTRLGIGRSFQITNIFPNLTVLENVRLAVQSRRNIRYSIFRHYQSAALEEVAYRYLADVNLASKAEHTAASLAHGEKRKLEIAILLALESKLLLLDEPTAGMSLEEVPAIIELIQKLKDQRERTILLIEHKMELVTHLSDSIAVLFHGKLLADGTPEEIMNNEQVQSAYLGGFYTHAQS